ncbi:GntR family transcriptional regulator [Hyphococcus luteus]|uniref:GntR family transcriptional regulator n=1 Tax=Hyphococcus luteus TaxID=2058213 RepID=A0A2S7K537_9PROT|nr:GntR family transcriptional regulator [Marinicaulis flavus]PQA87624.1 GntR family transcriptional regulator [Marinicaulis flavus]
MTAKTSPNKIVDTLRSMIIRGALAPGEHLGQAELAKRFGMSKVPVREALKQLAAEDLLQHDHNRGYFVSKLSLDEAKQLYRLRRWIEAELLAGVRWPTDEELKDFRRGFEELDRLADMRDRLGWAAALEQLRRSIFELSPEKVLLREALRLWSLTDRYRAVLPGDKSGSPERALVDALERRDRSALLSKYHADRDRVENLLISVLGDASADTAMR